MSMFKRSVIVFLMVLLCWHSEAQIIDSLRFNEIKERVSLLTDRDIYFVNEDILFAAQIVNNLANEQTFSQVIYIELIDYLGHSFNRGKYLLNQGFCNAKIQVPQTLITGTYYIKAYTKWMRNFSNQDYFYFPVTIINPQSNEVLNKAADYQPDFSLDTISYQDLDVYISKQKTTNGQAFLLQPNHAEQGSFVLSASKASAIAETYLKLRPIKKVQAPQNMNYLPETRGMSLSGQLILTDNNIPAKFATVYLTLLHKNNIILNSLTDEKGRFQFVLPSVYGSKEILLSVKNENNEKLQINVDNDYCEHPVKLPYISTSFINDRKEQLNPLSLISQINHYFESVDLVKQPQKLNYQSDLADDSKVVSLSNYVLLPELRDYFDELFLQIHIYKTDNNYKIMIDNSAAYSEMYIYQPLIKIDNVVVTDNREFLKVNPNALDRIEVFSKPYVVGKEIYGGLINVYSKTGNWADMKLPEGAVIFDYEMLSRDADEKHSLESSSGLANTIYWNARSVSSTDPWQINFDDGNNFGNYRFRVRFIDRKGEIAQKDLLLKIKNLPK